MAASLLQVPVEHFQHFVALASRPQTQTKELLHLRSRGWCRGTHWGQGVLDQGGTEESEGGGREREGWRRAAEPVFRVPESQSGQEVVVPSDTGQPSARSSCGSAGPPGTPLWSPHAPWPAAGHTHPPVSTTRAPSSGSLVPLPLLALLAWPTTHHLDLLCWPSSLWPVPGAAPLWQPSSGPQGWQLGP